MKYTVEQLLTTMESKGAVPPLFVWSMGFMDILDGMPKGGIPDGQHGRKNLTLEDAAEEYLDVNSFGDCDDDQNNIRVTKPSRIIDSRGIQVFP